MAAVLLAGWLAHLHTGDRDRFVTGSALGVGAGRATGGLASHSLVGAYANGVVQGSSGRCYAWTWSGRLVRVACPFASSRP